MFCTLQTVICSYFNFVLLICGPTIVHSQIKLESVSLDDRRSIVGSLEDRGASLWVQTLVLRLQSAQTSSFFY